MAQQKREDETMIDQVLRLAGQLSLEEQERLVEEMKLRWLRKAIDDGEDSIRQHGTRPAEDIFTELIEGYEHRKASQ